MSYAVGLKSFHVAELMSDEKGAGTTYDEVQELSEAISAQIEPQVASGSLYGDDSVVDTASKFNSATVTINTTRLPAKDEAILLGRKVEPDGTIGSKGTAPYLAFGYEVTMSDGSSEYWWLYKGRFQEPSRTNNTGNDSVEYSTPTIVGTFIRRKSDGEWKRNGADGNDGFNAGDTWFDEVYEPTAGDGTT
ncbi:major tail protein [Lentibacillus salicampi]|uniref:Phage tail protein n=1 Tax=Lentibacillus salicampi TaxID=175306 RepID=A0A4Y9AAC6_9BACI|nr:major tail protein [Lentibacillus salicampi]TFJ92137.1 phage tail protein [Lentibacillus salicampi]